MGLIPHHWSAITLVSTWDNPVSRQIVCTFYACKQIGKLSYQIFSYHRLILRKYIVCIFLIKQIKMSSKRLRVARSRSPGFLLFKFLINAHTGARVQTAVSIKEQDADWLHVGLTNPHNHSHRDFNHSIPPDDSSASSSDRLGGADTSARFGRAPLQTCTKDGRDDFTWAKETSHWRRPSLYCSHQQVFWESRYRHWRSIG